LIANAQTIFDYLKTKRILEKIQEDFSVGGKFDSVTIAQKGGAAAIKKKINEEIMKAGLALGLETGLVKNFQM